MARRKALAGERKFVEQRSNNYTDYYGSKAFIIEESVAKKNRYIYFAKFRDQYIKKDNTFRDTDLNKKLFQMIARARDIQIKREIAFVKKIQTYNKEIAKDFDPSLITPGMSQKNFKVYENFLENFLTVEGVRDAIFKPLTKDHSIFLNSVQETLDSMISKKIDYRKIDPQDEKIFTDSFRSALWGNISGRLEQKITNLKASDLGVDEHIREGLSGFGKITSRSKSKIYRYLKNGEKRSDEFFKELDFNKLHSNLVGMADEIANYLAFKMRAKVGSGNSKIGFRAGYEGSENRKTDLTMTVVFPKEDGKEILQGINISAKAATLTKDDFRTPSKFAEKSSLNLRYDEIRKFTDRKINQEKLNEVFYHINNQLANRMSIADSGILNVLSSVSINFMFEGMVEEINAKAKVGDGILNFFLLGGKLVPSSVIFDLMLTVIEEVGENPTGIARASFEGPPITPGDYYYDKENYEQVRSFFNGEDLNVHRTLPWQRMRNWLEEKSKMGFYLNTARIFKMLDLENLKD